MRLRLLLWTGFVALLLLPPSQIAVRVLPRVCHTGCEVAVQTFVEDDEIDQVRLSFTVDGADKGSDKFPVHSSVQRRTYQLDEPGSWVIRVEGLSGTKLIATDTTSVEVQ